MLRVVLGDITKSKSDIIVNATNAEMRRGGGVDGAIHFVGGGSIREECRVWRKENGELHIGQVVATASGKLHCKKIFHTVGPIWGLVEHREEMIFQLSQCYSASLTMAESLEMESIAFPNISTGVYAFPKPLAMKVVIKTVIDFLKNSPLKTLKKIEFVCFDLENFELYCKALETLEIEYEKEYF